MLYITHNNALTDYTAVSVEQSNVPLENYDDLLPIEKLKETENVDRP